MVEAYLGDSWDKFDVQMLIKLLIKMGHSSRKNKKLRKNDKLNLHLTLFLLNLTKTWCLKIVISLNTLILST